LAWLALGNSKVIDFLVKIGMGREGHPQFDQGDLKEIPTPELSAHAVERLQILATEGLNSRKATANALETSAYFVKPGVLRATGASLAERCGAWCETVVNAENTVRRVQAEIDEIAFSLFKLEEQDRGIIQANGEKQYKESVQRNMGNEVYPRDELVSELVSYCFGVIVGRWDVRHGCETSIDPELPEVFKPFSVCSCAMIQAEDGLPATEAPEGYPLHIDWDGILVDDPDHQDDIVRRVREVLEVIWTNRAEAIEKEACELLGVKTLRDYFRKPGKGGFWHDHVKRYSRSRRKAPIYWPLSTASGSYTVWLYYPRLTDQAPYTTVNKYLEPKIDEVQRAAARADGELAESSGAKAAELRDTLNDARALARELEELKQELVRIAALPYKPDLNDGVIINAAPLHKLFRHRGWAKECEKIWKKLERGEYDWSHMAYNIWPDRVREKCRKDRSLAIAHGLEDICEVPPPGAKKKRSRAKKG